jgi:esterase/lipase
MKHRVSNLRRGFLEGWQSITRREAEGIAVAGFLMGGTIALYALGAA